MLQGLPSARFLWLSVSVLAGLAACARPIAQRVTFSSSDGDAAHDGPRIVERLQAVSIPAELVASGTPNQVVIDLADAPDLDRILGGFGEPMRFHIHAVLDPQDDDRYRSYETRAAAEARIALWSPEQGVVPRIVQSQESLGDAPVTVFRVVFTEVKAIVDASEVVDATVEIDAVEPPRVVVHLNDEGAKRFETWTRGNVESQVAIMIDEQVLSTPVVKSAISGGRLPLLMPLDAPREVLERRAHLAAAALRVGTLRGTWTPSTPSRVPER